MNLRWPRLGLDEEAFAWLQAQGNMSQKIRELIHEKILANPETLRDIAKRPIGRPTKEQPITKEYVR
jgi:hypothetical protein